MVRELLEIARWTGSARNAQPWHLTVITDRARLQDLSRVRPPIAWIADAPLAIAIVLDGVNETTEAYDEGRVVERLLIGARLLGLGGGTAWFGDQTQRAEAKRLLGVPEDRMARSVIALGYPAAVTDVTPMPVEGGRRPLSELVSYDGFGELRTYHSD
jgi:nitroreductase